VHRVGRTARAGMKGHSLIFLLPSEMLYLNILAKHGNLKPTPLNMDSFFVDAVLNVKNTSNPSVHLTETPETILKTKLTGDSHHLSVNHAAQILHRTFQDNVSHSDTLTRKAVGKLMSMYIKHILHPTDFIAQSISCF
jgi:superfamily II DNA/RNA helicase